MILEKEPDNSDTINEIFRAAHSLKGMAGTMGYKRMQNLTHDMENVFSEVRNGNIKVDSRMVDVLFQCLDALEQYVNNIQETSDEGTDDNEPIIKALNSFIVNNEDKGVLPEEAKKEEAPAEEKKEESTDVAGTYARYNNMVFADFEKNAVNEAIEKKMNVFIIKVSVDENCILKAARAFLVFKNLEGHCDIIKSEPSAQDIEDEKFELDFSIVVVTERRAYETNTDTGAVIYGTCKISFAGYGRKFTKYKTRIRSEIGCFGNERFIFKNTKLRPQRKNGNRREKEYLDKRGVPEKFRW